MIMSTGPPKQVPNTEDGQASFLQKPTLVNTSTENKQNASCVCAHHGMYGMSCPTTVWNGFSNNDGLFTDIPTIQGGLAGFHNYRTKAQTHLLEPMKDTRRNKTAQTTTIEFAMSMQGLNNPSTCP